PTGIGVESTVVDASGEVPIILRPGGITPEQIAEITGEVAFDPGLTLEGVAPRSPGMKYRHYAPEGEMWLVEGDHIEDTISTINRLIAAAREQGRKVGVLTTEENRQAYPLADQVFPCGKREELITVARNLYDVLRKMDDKKVDFILSETFPEQGVGQAIMNRLRKAAGGKRYTP
ncbi:MAG TPA: threonylcarbamoyl-AMP synthase, partial [Paenibacillaceae bacterium]|nr:threonylcarbamoyl-AMP synthase [Paenibacillaceae bacterium]